MSNQFDVSDFFNDNDEEGATGSAMGRLGLWLLHLCKGAFVLYAMSHGISASWQYAGNAEWQKVAQSLGIIVTSLTLIGIYLAFLQGKIQGGAQIISAGLTYFVGFILEALAIVTDSQLNAGLALPTVLVFYLVWLLPLAPALMAAGGFAIHLTEPERIRQRTRERAKLRLEEERFAARMAQERAEIATAKSIKAMQLQARQAAAQHLAQVYASDQVQQAIMATAAAHAPRLLRQAGILVDDPVVPGANHQLPVSSEQLPVNSGQSSALSTQSSALSSENGKGAQESLFTEGSE